jgi:hypothetical protein
VTHFGAIARAPHGRAGVTADHGVNAAGSAGNTLGVNSGGNSANPALPNANANSAIDGSAGTKSTAGAAVGASSATDTTAMTSKLQKSTPSEARQSHQ